jgi:hypothetical protein
MGKRSRKRAGAGTPVADRPPPAVTAPERPAASAPHARTIDRRARLDEAPKAPWSPFPLVELCILLSLVLIVLGFVNDGPKRGVLLASGFTLVTLSSLELAIREHFTGYRSHSALLAGVCALAAVAPLYFFTDLPQEALLVVGALVFAAAFQALRSAFARKAGGLHFRA